MQAVLDLTTKLEKTASGKAWVIDFVNPRGVSIHTWVPLSHSKVEEGKLFVAEWLLEPRREGIGSLLKAGYKCLMGSAIVPQLAVDDARPALRSGVINKGFFTVEQHLHLFT